MGKHNYPKSRESNPNSQTQLLLTEIGHDKLYKLWQEYGMYKTADKIDELYGWWPSPYVLRYLSNRFSWKRTITDKNLPIYKGLLAGNTPVGHYKHIIFA